MDEDGGGSQRQRRAEHAAGARRKAAPRKAAKLILVALAIVAVTVLAVSAWRGMQSAQAACPGHFHAGYAVYVDGDRLTFPDTRSMAYGNPPADHVHHIHADDGIYHFHPAANRCIATQDMMQRLGVDVTADGLTVDAQHPGAMGEHRVGGNATMRILHQPAGEAWRDVAWEDIAGRQLGDGDRILITYGNLTEEMVAAQQAAMPVLGPDYKPYDV